MILADLVNANEQKNTGMTTSKGQQRRGAKAPASVPHRPKLLEWLKDPRNAVAYVEAVQALRNVAAEAQGGIAAVAERAGLSREHFIACFRNVAIQTTSSS